MLKRPKILVADDDEALRTMYRDRLRHEGFEIFEAKDGEEAIQVALREKPNLILLDLLMPVKGGLGVLEVLKTMPETKDVPVVILTAYPQEEYKMKGISNGAAMFISKSEVMPGDVVAKIKELLVA